MKRKASHSSRKRTRTGRHKQVAIIMGSKNDKPIMQDAAKVLKKLRVSFDVLIVSAHRTPEFMYAFSKSARSKGYKVIIAGAGGAAHLPGMVASLTTLPVIGVPIQVGKLKGLDALLSIAQMPKGVPVACVAVDNAQNAGLLAARIIGSFEPPTRALLEKFRTNQKNRVLRRS